MKISKISKISKIIITLVACALYSTSFATENQLDQYRVQINDTDKEIIQLIAKRYEIVKQVGEFKKENNLAIFDPNREAKLKAYHTKLADEYGVSPEIINSVFDIIITHAKTLEV